MLSAQASAIADRAAIAACASSLPSMIRHGDQRVSELVRSCVNRLGIVGMPDFDDGIAVDESGPRVHRPLGQAPLLDLGDTSKKSFTSRVP